MKETDNCLLIGNGLNQCLTRGVPWGDLLKDIAQKYSVDYHSDISMPLEFERIVNSCLSRQTVPSEALYLSIKQDVADKVRSAKLSNAAPHHRLPELPISSVITTNYDSLLEQAFFPNYIATSFPKNYKYLKQKTDTIQGVDFYHPHGIASSPQTICLGYEHYIGVAQGLRTDLNSKNKATDQKSIYKVLTGGKDRDFSWGEKFYFSNIGIIGLGLYECEIDLWWLLTHRSGLYYSNYQGIQKLLRNNIVYYDIIDDIPEIEEKKEQFRQRKLQQQANKHILLQGEHVTVRKYSRKNFDGSFEAAYLQMFDDIKHNGIE